MRMLIKILCLKSILHYSAILSNSLYVKAYNSSLRPKNYKIGNSSNHISLLNDGSEGLNYAFFQIMQLLSSFVLTISTLLLIIFSNPLVVLILLFIGSITYYIFYGFSKKTLIKNDSLIKNNLSTRLMFLKESFANIRQIILYSLQDQATKRIINIDKDFRKASTSNILVVLTPKPIIEGVAIFITLIISYFVLSNVDSSNYQNVFIKVGFLLIASQKLIQSINLIFSCLSSVKGRNILLKEYLNLVNSFYRKNNINKINEKLSWKILNFNNVSFSYLDKNELILDQVNFSINNGENIGICGKTGSGKSTILDLIMGFVKPISGEILVDGKSLYFEDNFLKAWQSQLAHVEQTEFFNDEKLLFNLTASNPNELIDENHLLKIVSTACIDFVEHEISQISNKDIGENGSLLSGGQRQRISIARALYRKPKLLLLDEATSALDQTTEKRLCNNLFLNKQVLTTIVISHKQNVLSYMDKVFCLKDGKIIIQKST